MHGRHYGVERPEPLTGDRIQLRGRSISLSDKSGRHSELPVMSHAHNTLRVHRISTAIAMLGESEVAIGCERVRT
jgi:hypothetical protein